MMSNLRNRSFFTLLAILACGTAAASDVSLFKDIPTYDMSTRECDNDDTGSNQISCKYIEIGHLNGFHTNEMKADPRYTRIYKYIDDDRLKFAGVACARNSNVNQAEIDAKWRAHKLVEDLKQKFDDEVLTGAISALGYLEGDHGYKCVTVPTTRSDQTVASSDGGSDPEEGPMIPDPVAVPPPPDPNPGITWHVTNHDRYLVFFDVHTRDNKRVWWQAPADQIYLNSKQHFVVLSDGEETDSMSCRRGEWVCWGAARTIGNYRTTWWGEGVYGNQGCEHCCHKCEGQTVDVTLADGGEYIPPPVAAAPPSPQYQPQRSAPSGGDLLGALAGVATGVLQGVQAGQAAGGFNYRSAPANIPRTKKWIPSDISGTQ